MDQESLMKRWRRTIYGLWFHGDRFTCPFCNHSFAKFLPGGARTPEVEKLQAIGIGRRDNARCPHCGSNDRARLMLLYLRSTECFSNRPLRVLHIAPDRHVAGALRALPNIDYVCGSIEPQDFSDLGALSVDVTNIPFSDDSFDVVLCNHVLQQVADDRLAMREISRVLRPGGWGTIQVPVVKGQKTTVEDSSFLTPQERRKRYGSTMHFRLYGSDYSERLGQEKLNARSLHPIREGWCLDAERYATIENEEIFLVSPESVCC